MRTTVDTVRLEASGLSGRICVGYQVAAELGGWRVSLAPRLPRTYVVEATVARWDEYWRAESPWSVTLNIGNASWVWGTLSAVSQSDTSVTFEVSGMPSIVRYAGMNAGGSGHG